MDDLNTLALAWNDPPSDIALPITTAPGNTYSSEIQTLRTEGDSALIALLISRLSTLPNEGMPGAAEPVAVPAQSMLGLWSEVFRKAINSTPFIAWAEAQRVDLKTLKVHNSALHVIAHGVPKVFTLADTSGWWALANPIIYISQLVDPMTLGMPYARHLVSNDATTLPLDLTLAFHGYPMPANRLTALAIIEELQALQGFPAFDDNGRSKSIIPSELTQQRRDYHQFADTLERLIKDENHFFTLDIYRTRLHLESHSKLARTLKEAAALLQAIMDENDLSGTPQAPTRAHFDDARKLICVIAQDDGREQTTFAPASPDTRWERLNLLSEQLGIPIYPAHSVGLVDALQAYAIERPVGRADIKTLIQHLRQWAVPAEPAVLRAERSLTELVRFRRHVGLLNDRQAMRTSLSKVIEGGNLQGPNGLDRIMPADPDAIQAAVKLAYSHLHKLTDDPAFQAIRTRERIDPASHVLLSASGSIGARGLDGTWKSLADAVAEHDHLMLLMPPLKKLAAKTGGQLRTTDAVSLSQALRLYQFQLPTTLPEAHILLQRLQTNLALPAAQGCYWRALTPASAQSSAWSLSLAQRQLIVTICDTFMEGHTLTLFGYMSQAILVGKSLTDVRAEADNLLMRLLASPPAQQLGEQLSNTLHWHGAHASDYSGSGSRNALILAALLLNLDPHCDVYPTRIRYLDWQADYYWGESVPFVCSHIETTLGGSSEPVAALATHLVLSRKAPHLLVRSIPDTTPYLGSHTWLLFHHYVMYMEKVLPGSSRQMTYSQIMFLAYLPPHGHWKTFLDSPPATVPILDWAVVNGILVQQGRYGLPAVNRAIEALNAQRARLTSALDAFAEPIVSLRQTARDDLRKVYPQNTWLQTPILMWLPHDSPFSEDGHFEDVHTGPKYSFVDLHMAGELKVATLNWHSSQADVKYREMAKRFHLLEPISSLFLTVFEQKLKQLKAAYRELICYWLSQLTLPHREALEYGHVQLFSLSRSSSHDDGPARVGRFGVLVGVRYGSERHLHECFPRQLLIRRRHDIHYQQVMAALDSGTHQPWMRFDWAAYEHGHWPAAHSSVPSLTDLVITLLGNPLPEAAEMPPLDHLGRRVPRTLDSPRSHALANAIIEHQLEDSRTLREKAKQPITLSQATNNIDPWSDYLRSMALKSA
ncbi:hypothetical protein PspS35_16510 [Pseudomonas sp. S35]|uniref:hypothetical protein n=1 Tax=Pseudomonas sp. S35 TaxID=1573719 RepID=UPI00132EE30C|nr:hypothetical protein [Pseudomonas sp. S35]QHF45310.1 hypothetical protein PspS35_16510 [Pseudomonas sp. S35]